jgi:hypothetical protein
LDEKERLGRGILGHASALLMLTVVYIIQGEP